MSSLWKRIVLLLVILETFNSIVQSLQIYGVQDLCGKSIELKSPIFGLESSAILKPKQYGGDAYDENRVCSLVVKRSFSQYKLVVSVRTLDFRPDGVDTLTIDYVDGYRGSKVFKNYKSYSNREHDRMESKSFRSSEDITITFSTSSGWRSTALYEGFALVVTVVQDAPCGSYYFSCKSGLLCVSKQLTCDGHNHCGDRSDQSYCGGASDYHTDTRVLWLAIGIPSAIAVLMVLVYLKRHHSTTTQLGFISTNTSYPGSNLHVTSTDSYGGGIAATTTYIGSGAAGGYPANPPTYVESSAVACSPANSPTYVGSIAAPSSPANSPNYVGSRADACSPANSPTYVGSSAAASSPANSPTYVGSSAAASSPAY